MNFNDWHVQEKGGAARILTVDAKQWIVLRWDLNKFRKLKAEGPAVLELTTHSLAIGGNYAAGLGKDLGEEFGKIRVIEILGGDPNWDQNTVSYDSLVQGARYEDVFNTQMIIDRELAKEPGEKAYFTLRHPVMQRLLEGTTKGLLIRPLGALSGFIYASEQQGSLGAKLHFNTERAAKSSLTSSLAFSDRSSAHSHRRDGTREELSVRAHVDRRADRSTQ